MKKWLAVLLVMAMMLSMLPMIALAQETGTKVYLKPNANWLQKGHDTDPRFAIYYFNDATGSNGWTNMVDSDGDDVFEGTVPAGYPNLIFCRMNGTTTENNWDNKYNQTDNLTVPTNGNNLYTVQEGTWDKGGGTWSELGGAVVEPDYYVTGTLVGMGDNWTPNDENYKMTKGSDGAYTLVVQNVAAGDYKFLVTDGSWDNKYPSSDYYMTTTDTGNVTVTLKDGKVTATGEHVIPYMVAVGGGIGSWLNGEGWNLGSTANKLTYQGDGKYTISYANISAGTYEMKFAANNTWSNEFNLTGTFVSSGEEIVLSGSGANMSVVVAEDADKVTIDLDLNAEGGPKAVITILVERTVTFNPGEGTVDPTSAKTTNNKLTSLPTPTRTGYTFNGWFTAATGGDQVTANTVFNADTEIFAQWTLTEYTITLDGNEGTLAGGVTSLSTQNNKLTAMPADPTREGYEFLGWFDALTGGNKITTDTVFSGNATIYAQWKKLPVITFDAGEGTVTPATAVVGADGKLTSLPTPTRDGYTFEGWYNGENKAELADVYTADTTLTAKWTKNAPAPQGVTYVVAGTEALLGKEWNASGEFNAMTKKSDGTYELKLTNVAAANNYQLKVVGLETGKDAAWYGDANGQNVTFNVTAACDVTITFNPETKEIKVTGEKVAFANELNVGYWAAVGNGSGSWLNGATWKPAEAANKMTANGKVYTITFKNVAKGSLEVKFAADGDWAHNFGNNGTDALAADKLGTAIDAKYNGDNFKFTNPYDKADITLTLDLTNFNFADKSGAKVTIALAEVTSTGDETPGGDTTPGGDDTTGDDTTGGDSTTGGDTTPGGTTTPDEVTEITVYAKVPENWDGPGVWAWNDKQENAFEAWPGLAMTQGEDGWWYAKVPAWVENIIINAHGGAWQTADLDLEKLEMDVWVEVTVDEAGQASTKITYSNPKTGEGDAMFAVAAALLLASAALVTTVASKKKFF